MASTASLTDEQYKDCSPRATAHRITSILREYGIDTEVQWLASGVPYCYANCVSVPGTTFKTYGKGLTEELALASGYGELIERLQIGFIYGPTSLKDGDYAIDDPKFDLVPLEQLLQSNPDCYRRLAAVYQDAYGVEISPKQILNQFATKEGKVAVSSHLDLITGETILFPTVLRKRIYGTNGCAAGNTPEEALVQAISEIVERNHKIRALKDELVLPDIPDEFLKQHEIAYQIISFVREQGYKVIIKDASLNTGFPVVCACIIDKRTGRYHTHFGCHPVFRIALERSLTETFQGRSINSVAHNEDFSPKNKDKFSLSEMYSELRFSSGSKLPKFFVDTSDIPFDPNIGTTGSNRDILRFCKNYFAERNLSLLIKDYSCLGFPTYQILVPGYSEAYINRIHPKTDDQRYAPYAISTLRNPTKATIPDMLGLMMHLDNIRSVQTGNSEIHSFSMLTKQPSSTPAPRQRFLKYAALGYVYYAMGKFSDTAQCIHHMQAEAGGNDLEYLICLKRYLSMLAEGYTPDYALKTVTFFHSEESVDKLAKYLQTKTNPLDGFILKCDKNCTEECLLHGQCYMKRVDSIAALLDEKMKDLSFDEMKNYLCSIT